MWSSERNKLTNMISEYFVDFFSVQFIGRHKIISPFIWQEEDNPFSEPHPSTSARTKAINNFLREESQHDEFNVLLKNYTSKITGRNLKIRNIFLTVKTCLGENHM